MALAFSKQKILRFWGLTGQRGWARLILDRLHDLVLSPGDFKGGALDPDTVAHEHHSIFFPDNGHGAANLPGATAAKANPNSWYQEIRKLLGHQEIRECARKSPGNYLNSAEN
jgi:hypothetical protein